MAHPLQSNDQPDFDLAKYQNYLRILAEVQLGQWLQSRVGASDIVQESLIDAMRDQKTFRGTTEAELLGWLRAIVLNNVNRAVDFHVTAQKRSIRREVSLNRLQSMHQSSVAIEAALASQINSPSESVARHEQLLGITDCMAELSADHREVLLLRTMQGKGYLEIAQLMDRSEAACRMLWLRAIEELRRKFSARSLI